MRRMEKTAAACLMGAGLCLALVGSAMAQPGGGQGGQRPSPPSASELVSKMKQALNLTDEQVSQVTTIIQEEISQMESLMKSGNPESGRSQMETIRKNTESKLAEVLTAEQLSSWKSSMSQKQGGNSGSRPSGGPGGSSSTGSSRSSGTSGIW